MSKRRARPVVAVASLMAATLLLAPAGRLSAAGPSPQATAPNIVFIFTDDQRWDTLWAMPNVQSLIVSHGVNFTNAFVVNPLCCPSRVSMLTGQYSHSSGVYRNVTGFEDFDDSSSIATWLDAAGYRTGFVGKYVNGYKEQDAAYIPPGWDRWVAFTDARYFNYDLSVDGEPVHYGNRPQDYATDVLAGYAEEFILDTAPDEPLFLIYAPKAPHAPAIPAPRHVSEFSDLPRWRPPSYNEADVSDKPAWVRELPSLSTEDQATIDALRIDMYRTLLAVDDAVEGIVDTLASTGRLSSTLVVFASDNGYLWGEHRWESKRVMYEESIRIPLVIRYDPLTQVERRDGRIVLNVDLPSTFAELGGTSSPGAEGVSLMDVIANQQVPWRKDFLIENSLDVEEPYLVPTYCAVRTKNYVSALFMATGENELYDLKADVISSTTGPRTQGTPRRRRSSASA